MPAYEQGGEKMFEKRLILLDMETQRDFFMPGGSFYSHRAGEVRNNIYKLFDWAEDHHIPVLSSVLRVRQGELGPLGPKPHCVEATPGEQKLPRTLQHPYIDLGIRNSTDLPDGIFDLYRQVIVEKRNPDLFMHARTERLFTELEGYHGVTFIACGANVDSGMTLTLIGLRARGFSVVLAADAVVSPGRWDAAELQIPRLYAKGVMFMKTSDIVKTPAEAARDYFRNAKTLTPEDRLLVRAIA